LATLRRISDFKPTLTNVAQTTHFQVLFNGFRDPLKDFLSRKGVDIRFITENAGLLCYSASLPGSSFATSDIVGNFTGVVEKFAHTRQFTQIDLEFYVDREYKTIKFLEHWMEFISSGSGAQLSAPGYFYRMQYPSDYKSDQTKILKFERDYGLELEYNFFGLFPLSMSSVSVSYTNSDILRASATFNYERYVCGRVSSLSQHQGTDSNNNPFNQFKINPVDPLSVFQLSQSSIDLTRSVGNNTTNINPQSYGSLSNSSIKPNIAYEGTRFIP
jgi:hypothetical protein